MSRLSQHLPTKVARVSPMVARIIIDGDYLRAMFGSLWATACIAALGLGAYAGVTTRWYAVPPSFGLFLAILAVGVFDATFGYLAGVVFIGGALVTGHLTTAPEFREALGLVLMWFAVPLSAAAIRPLRRAIRFNVDGMWERATDLVIGSLFAAWVAQRMLDGLSVLAGFELPIGASHTAIALAVIGFVALRLVIETVASMHFPDRLEQVHHLGKLEAERWQVPISLVIQVIVFVFVADAFVDAAWALVIGAVIFFVPSALEAARNKVGKSKLLTKWTPRALLKWSLIIYAAVVLRAIVDSGVHQASMAEDVGFIVLPLPLVVFWTLDLFVDDEAEEGETRTLSVAHKWTERIAGVVLITLATYFVTQHFAS